MQVRGQESLDDLRPAFWQAEKMGKAMLSDAHWRFVLAGHATSVFLLMSDLVWYSLPALSDFSLRFPSFPATWTSLRNILRPVCITPLDMTRLSCSRHSARSLQVRSHHAMFSAGPSTESKTGPHTILGTRVLQIHCSPLSTQRLQRMTWLVVREAPPEKKKNEKTLPASAIGV